LGDDVVVEVLDYWVDVLDVVFVVVCRPVGVEYVFVGVGEVARCGDEVVLGLVG